MPQASTDMLSFDVLLRGGEAEEVVPAASTIDQLRPPPGAIERCYRWFAERGVTCHRTDFGLACQATVALFEKLFGVKVRSATSPNGQRTFTMDGQPGVPSELSDMIEQVTIARPPTFF